MDGVCCVYFVFSLYSTLYFYRCLFITCLWFSWQYIHYAPDFCIHFTYMQQICRLRKFSMPKKNTHTNHLHFSLDKGNAFGRKFFGGNIHRVASTEANTYLTSAFLLKFHAICSVAKGNYLWWFIVMWLFANWFFFILNMK